MKTKRLGKGLSALISQEEIESITNGDHRIENLTELDVSLISPNPYQPRLDFNLQAMNELKESIRDKGLIQPITVRKVNHHYELIAGERRLRAAIEVGLGRIPAYIINIQTKEEMLEFALIENVQREKLNPIEQAQAFLRLINECNLTQDEVAQKISKDRSTITNLLRLLKLPKQIQDSIKTGEISVGHGRALVSIEDIDYQKQIWQKVLKQGLSVRILEKLVKEHSEVKPNKSIKVSKKSVYISKIEDQLRDTLGTKVSIRSKKEGGCIEIEFYSPEDLNRLVEIFNSIR
jgi:ParB family chromosome partitioning protein